MDEDIGDDLVRAIQAVAYALSADATPSMDATGGFVESLTESVMGVTAGLVQIAAAINNLADAVRESKE